jgi:cation diffusion facilitator CzcD-associated flavoprotein CzcO
MSSSVQNDMDVIVIGAGFAGLYALHRLRAAGFTTTLLEAGEGVGGTWYWNRYPGARCDVPSLEYSYSFSDELQQDWAWAERYAAQPELERYLNHVADRFDLRRDILLGHRVTTATFNSGSSTWTLVCDSGETFTPRFVVFATGGYSTPLLPQIEGVESFAGELYHTALWPHDEVTFAGKRIGVIGTGSSGMQAITEIAKLGPEHLYVFQRTPNYSVPANNHRLDDAYQNEFKRTYAEHRAASRASSFGVAYPVGSGRTTELTQAEFDDRVQKALDFGGPALLTAFPDFLIDEQANHRVAEYLRGQVRARVNDPVTAEKLCAKAHYLGARRLLVEQGYLEAYNRPNVTLIDISEDPIRRITADSVVVGDTAHQLDMLVLATGFDSGSGTMLGINPVGTDGDLRRHWADGPSTYLGMSVAAFPNMFMLYAPGSPGIRAQGALMGEIQSEWIAELLAFAREHRWSRIDTSADAARTWTAHVAEVADSSLVTKNDTTYVGSNVPGKPRVYAAYLGGVAFYTRFTNSLAEAGYPGLRFSSEDGALFDAGAFQAPSLSDIRVSAI